MLNDPINFVDSDGLIGKTPFPILDLIEFFGLQGDVNADKPQFTKNDVNQFNKEIQKDKKMQRKCGLERIHDGHHANGPNQKIHAHVKGGAINIDGSIKEGKPKVNKSLLKLLLEKGWFKNLL